MDLARLTTPILLRGNETTAYRDPAAIYHNQTFHLYFTVTQIESSGDIYQYIGTSTSRDLTQWSEVKMLTPRDRALNFSSPGNIIRYKNRWVLCLQTYPRPNAEKYGNETARVWTMQSDNLTHWAAPELLRVKGPDNPVEEMGRMIDPFLIEDRNDPSKWWCLYKQNGVSASWSRDLQNWTYAGSRAAGENVCVIVDSAEYVMFHSPENGIGVKRSSDLMNWTDEATITLGQKNWDWARGRLTAGFVLDLRDSPEIGKYLLFFHGSGPEDERTTFDNHASIGIAWSDNLHAWSWPGK
jgi:hypothetical protein